MDIDRREAQRMLAAQLGHASQVMADHFYVSPRVRDLQAAQIRAFMVTAGTCPLDAGGRTCDLQPCLSAPMLLPVKPPVLNPVQYEGSRLRTSIARGLLRSWSDLDRSEALAGHLAALEEQLR